MFDYDIKNKQNHNVIDWDYTENNHDSRVSGKYRNPLPGFQVSIFSDNVNECNKRNYQSVGIKVPQKEK